MHHSTIRAYTYAIAALVCAPSAACRTRAEPVARPVGQHLAALAHLAQGEWRTDIANGSQQRDVWTWGPGRHALTSITSNSEGTNQATFGSFRAIYHHPQRDELAVLALSGPALIQVGTLTPLEGLDLRFDMTLFYDQAKFAWAAPPMRRISSVWTFDAPTRYVNHWIEDDGQPVPPSTTAWSYARHDEVTPLPASATEPPARVEHLRAFLPFLERAWTTDATRTTFAWIPYSEAIVMRTIDTRTRAPIAETFFYAHPHAKTIHTLTIHDTGAIDEGTASTDAAAIVIHARRADHATTTRVEQRLEQASAETIHIQTWAIAGTARTPLADTTHRAAPR
jgi:hypothetical protein